MRSRNAIMIQDGFLSSFESISFGLVIEPGRTAKLSWQICAQRALQRARRHGRRLVRCD
jgi:hypothetical protein